MSIETSEAKALPTVDLAAPNPVLGDKAPKTMEQVRAARYEASAEAAKVAAGGDPAVRADATPAPGAAPVVDPKKPEDSTAVIDMDEATLKAATALSREAREAKAKAKEFEAKAAEVAPLVAAKALVAQGKHLEAIKALGIDLNAAVAETLSGPGEAAEPTAEAKELARLASELEAVKADQAARLERDKGDEAKRFEAMRQEDVKNVGEFVKKEDAKYPFLARSEKRIAAAYEGAVDANNTLVEKLGRQLTEPERHKLVLDALAEREAWHAEEAKLDGAGVSANPANVRTDPTPSTASARPTTFSGDLRGGTVNPVTKQRSRMTFSEAKRARRDATNG